MERLTLVSLSETAYGASLNEDRFVARVSCPLSIEVERNILAKLKKITQRSIRILVIDCSAFDVGLIGPSQRLHLGGPAYLNGIKSQGNLQNLGFSKVIMETQSVVFIRPITDQKMKIRRFLAKAKEWSDPCEAALC